MVIKPLIILTEWLVYLIHKFLAPNGYVLNGVVEWSGEESGDVGEIFVEDNKVFIQEWKGNKHEVLPTNNMRTDIVLSLDSELDSVQKSLFNFRLETSN